MLKRSVSTFFTLLFATHCLGELDNAGSDWMLRRINKRDLSAGVDWALDRLNEEVRALDGKIEDVAAGDIYVVGGGVRATHAEFGSRVLSGHSLDGSDSREDCSGGVSTGAASIAIGGNNGIARSANVIPVKVGCGSSVSSSALSRGLQWVEQHISSVPSRKAVILLTFPLTDVVSEINRLAEQHLVIIPAGDSSSDRCRDIASADEVGVTVVASSTSSDSQSVSSNYGSCVDIWAPGQDVSVASSTDDTSIKTDSGTVYAAAAVAGVAIQNLIQIREAGDVTKLKGVLLSRATKQALTLSPSAKSAGTPNRLLFDICPFYKRPDHGKCYVAQTKQLIDETDNGRKMTKAAKSVVTWDDMAYNYYEDCFTVLVFSSSETATSVTATHNRDGSVIKDTIFKITTASSVITLESGPTIRVDEREADISSMLVGTDYSISLADHEVRTQQDDRRFVPVVTVSLAQNVTVSFDGHQQIRLDLNDIELFREKTEGICGFLDNSHVREFVDRNGNDMEFTFKENKKKFVEEWKEGDSTCDGPPDNLCNDESKCQTTAEEVCYPLKDIAGPFNQCFETLDPSSWYTNCVDAVKECCCNEVNTDQCSCEEQEKYWFAALLEGCTADLPCDNPCEKPETDEECVDDAGKETNFFYKEKISYDPKDNCHYVDKHDDIECKHDGTWNRDPSDCMIKTCTTPGLTDFVEFLSDPKNSYSCGDKVGYTCTKTECDCNCYEMNGNPDIQCVSNGDRTAGWNRDPPTCSLKECADPRVPTVDKGIDDSPLSWVEFTDKSCCSGRVTYHCHECYELSGAAEVGCCNNKWGDGSLPTCKLKHCVDPQVEIDNSGDSNLAIDNKSGNTCSSEITYYCDNSCYEIEGSATRTCQPDGSWSGDLPRCVKKKCPAVSLYDDGKYLLNGAVVEEGDILECGDTLHVQCNECHFPCTSTCERTCKWNGTDTVWSNSEPQCAPIMCRQRNVPNAVVSNKRGALRCGESSTAACNTCYKQVGGDNVRTCEQVPSNTTCPLSHVDGRYTGEEIQCVKMECPDLVLGDNIRIKEETCTNDHKCNCVVTFECDSDCYEMNGSPTLTCTGEGWDYDVPTCTRKTCPWRQPDFSRRYNYDAEWPGGCQFESSVDGRRVTEDDTFYCGDIVDVEAVDTECYHVCDKDRLMCQEDGTWNVTSFEIPSCVYMQCDAPEPVENARLTNDDQEYNCTTTLRWECDRCYQHVGGDLERECVAKDIKKGPKGQWSGQPPVCELMACADDQIPNVANATVTKETLSCGGKLKYQCNECTELVGNEEVYCAQPDLTRTLASWVNTPPSCDPICCPPLDLIPSEDADYQVISTGARFKHGPTGKCGDNYVCQSVEAPCDECFEFRNIEGDSSDSAPARTCVKKGTSPLGYWTNTDKVCSRKECSVNQIPRDNHLHYKEVSSAKKCNQTIEVECDCCHKMTNDIITATLQCLPSKLWDKELPVCSPITCSDPAEIENGSFKFVESESCTCGTVRYECDPCYRLVGSETLTCNQNSGTGTAAWSSSPPVCEPICCEHLEEPIDPITDERSTELIYKKGPREVGLELGEMTVKENYDTCTKDYVCQTIDPICGPCFEYTDGSDGRIVDGMMNPPSKQCVKREEGGVEIGEWTNKDKFCTLKKCPYREINETMHLHYSFPETYSEANPAHCRSNVTVTCDECYELSDGSRSQTHVCQKDKTWSYTLPTCQRSECASPPPVEHCTYKDGDNKCSYKRELECDECYFEESCPDETMSMDGVLEVQCNYDKTWTWTKKEPKMNLRQCEEAPHIENGQVDSTGAGCGDMARYRCDRCYRFSHDSECLCERRKCIPDPSDCTKGMWNETAPTCEKITCPDLPSPPTNGRLVRVDGTCDGSAVYECDEGYYLTDGDLVRNCTEWGRWSGKHPVCSIKTCTAIGDSPNRSHFPQFSHTFGTVVRFECDDCYSFMDSFTDESVKDAESIYPRFHVLRCEATGNWNGSFPVCQEKRCSNPGIPANGRLTSEANYQCGGVVTYKCNDGYRFTEGSSASRTCNGETWSGTAPECEAVDCGDVIVSSPLVADHIDTLYGYEVTYSCGKNAKQRRCYNDPAPEEAICQEDGTWSFPHSGCQRLQCPTPPTVPNSTMRKTKVNLRDTDCYQVMYYECDEGYKLRGASAFISCTETTWWPSNPPTCEKMACQPQNKPVNGDVTPSFDSQRNKEFVSHGARINYTCDECYELQGAEIRECVSSGQGVTWSSPEPTCSQKLCYLPGIANGRISSYHDALDLPACGEVVEFECDFGYKLVGSKSARCDKNKKYDTILPTCEQITCPEPEQRDHMTTTTYPEVTDGKYKPFTEIEYECEDGWNLEGKEIISCLEDGTWSKEAPTCVPSKCKDLDDVIHGTIVEENAIQRRIECDTCYRPTNPGAQILRCHEGSWTPPVPTKCEVIQCSNPLHAVENGRISAGAIHECGQSITFECEEGHAMHGQATLTCGEEGWDKKFPLCIESRCEDLETVENAQISFTHNGQQVHYVCDEGYELYGDPVRKCMNGSQWSGPGPTSCRYQLIGESERTCTNNQQWSYAPPECKCVSCPVLSLDNGKIETADENKVGTTVQYICDPGYKLVPEGKNSRMCQENGQWDGIAPQCERVKCKRKIPEGSRIEGTDKSEYNYLDTVQFVCEPYKNKLVYTCGEDGLWQGDVDKSCALCKERRKEIVTYITKVIPGSCILGTCTRDTTVQFPMTNYETEIVCD
ncbi:hypothetical protein ACHWQZ_G019426 [Mnemiopsis leidyi]